MKRVLCPVCKSEMHKNGKTSSGRQRWRCPKCGSSTTLKYDDTQKRLDEFLLWLLSKDRQIDKSGAGRGFRRKTRPFWAVWPLPRKCDEYHRILYVDGIWLERKLVILIVCSDEKVISWFLAQGETKSAWEALMAPIPAPQVVVSDGGTGFASAVRKVWPKTKVQRCIFHAFCQVKRYTTSRPRSQAGKELYRLAIDLLNIEELYQAQLWVEHFLEWCEFWHDFLEVKTYKDGIYIYANDRLRKARQSLLRLLNKETLFTYLDPRLCQEGPIPSTNNKIESLNANLRAILRNHRGLSKGRRVKAVYWYCYTHAGYGDITKEVLKTMPTDNDIDLLYQTYAVGPKREDGGPEWGTRPVWEELHNKTPYPFSID